MGELGLSYAAYCDLTVIEILWMLEGYHKRWEEGWKHTRELIATLSNINRGKGQPAKKAREIMPLPSEIRAENELIEVGGKEMTLKEWQGEIRLKAELKSNEQKDSGAGTSN